MSLPSPPQAPLPATLRLPPHRSLLRLGPRSRLLGLDPAAVAVDDLPPALALMLDTLTDPVPTAVLLDRAVAHGASADEAEELLRELVAAGALVDAAGPPRCARRRAGSTVIVHGGGPIAAGVALGLAVAGVGRVHVDATGTVQEADLGTGLLDADLGRAMGPAIAAAVRRVRPQVTTGPPPLRTLPDLVVLADVVPEPARIDALLTRGVPHLAAHLRDGVGVVGPLVLPGRTACLGCLELHRRARDAAWPAVAAQLAGRAGRADPSCAAAAAALASAQVVAALDGTATGTPPPPTLDATVEVDATAGTLLRREWPPRADCRCGAGRGGRSRMVVGCVG